MQLLEGETLLERIQRQGRLATPELKRVARQVAEALKAAHSRGIIHRDIKPANLYLTREGQAKVLDFGLARIRSADDVAGDSDNAQPPAMATVAGAVMGTAAYMSPEQIRAHPLDHRTDIFSFGLVLYEMATGAHPFADAPEPKIREALLSEPIPAASLRNPSLPRWLGALISRMLEKDCDSRIQRIDEVLEVLEAHAGQGTRGYRGRIIAAGALIGVLALWATASRWRAESPNLSVVPVTSTSGLKEHVAVSPDGSRIAFAWYSESGSEDIFTQDLNSHTAVRLTTDPARDFSPSWSADGKSIAFLRTESGHTAYFVVQATGGPARKLGEVAVNPAPFCRQLDWSRTENQLAVAEWRPIGAGGPAVLLISAANGRELRRVPVGQSGFVCAPAFSPDGRQLAFLSGPDFRAADVHVVPIAGGPERRITSDARMMQGLAWAPDGASIVYSLRRSGPFGLWRAGVIESGASPLLETGNDVVDPWWSEKGLMFVRDMWDTNLWRAEAPGGRETRVEPSRLVASTREEASVDVSPDGKRIAFASARTGGFELWVADADGSGAQQLTDFKGPETGYPPVVA